MPSSLDYVSGVEREAGIAPNSSIRHHILSTLNHDTIITAASLHTHWSDAATNPAVWSRIVETSSSLVLRDACARDPLRLPSPGMFRIVYEVCEERAGELVAITRFEPSGVWGASKFNKEDKLLFTRALVPLFTVPEFWLHALAAMQVICRCQAFLLSPEEAPPDQWALPPLHRLWHLMAVVCENHRIGPQRAAIPWLLCLYEWAALAPSAEKIAFNKMMLGPATVVIRSDAVPPTISDITTIIQLTTMLLVRHKDFSTRPSSVVLGDTLPLPNDDPRTAYGVYIHILLRFPQHRDTILHTVSANLGEVGIWELELARTRVIGLLTASDMLEKDPKLFANIPESFAFNDAPQSIVAEREKEARDWEDGLCDNDLL